MAKSPTTDGWDQGKWPCKEPEVSAEERLDRCQKSLWSIIARIVDAIDRKYGEEGCRVIFDHLRNWPEMWEAEVKECGVRSGEATPLDVALKIFDSGDYYFFSMKQKRRLTAEPDENRLLYAIVECNVADMISSICPKACSVVSRAMEQGVAETANPNIKISGDRYLACGDEACYISIEKKILGQKQRRYSERHT